jgi:uncharacterized protein with PIN domain
MRLLADENVPLDTVRALRSAGHDVYSATEGGPGASDLSHVEMAVREDRLIVTFDQDFGEIAVRGLHIIRSFARQRCNNFKVLDPQRARQAPSACWAAILSVPPPPSALRPPHECVG